MDINLSQKQCLDSLNNSNTIVIEQLFQNTSPPNTSCTVSSKGSESKGEQMILHVNS